MVAIEGRGREGSQVEWVGCEATQKIERGPWCIPQSWEGHLWDSLILSSNTYVQLPLVEQLLWPGSEGRYVFIFFIPATEREMHTPLLAEKKKGGEEKGKEVKVRDFLIFFSLSPSVCVCLSLFACVSLCLSCLTQ